MTDKELRDAAVAKFASELAHLRLTTRGLKNFTAPPSSEWGKALKDRSDGLALLAQIGGVAPPPPPPPPPPPSGDWFPASWLSGPSDEAIFRQAMPPRKGCLVGIWDSGHPGISRITQREGEVGRTFDFGAASYYGAELPGSDGKVTLIKQGGRLPLLDAGQYGATNVSQILNGSKDTHIRNWVKAASAIGGPVLVRHFHEYAGPWMPSHWFTGGVNQAGSARCTSDQWKAMNRRPVDIAKAEGITNLIWIWCPTTYDDRASVWASYPGDDYVDIVGDDGYTYADVQWNGDVQKWTQHWENFNYPRRMTASQEPTFRMLHDAFPHKPFGAMEAGCTPHSTDASRKPQWIRNIVADSPTYLDRMVIHVYSDYDDGAAKWTLDNPPAALDAYRDMVNAPYFKTRA